MTAYRRVYDSRHMQADCKEPGSASESYARNRVSATFLGFLNFTFCKSLLGVANLVTVCLKSNCDSN